MQDLCSENGLELSQWRELKFTEEEVQTWLLEQISSPKNRPPASTALMKLSIHLNLRLAEKQLEEVHKMLDGCKLGELGESERKELKKRLELALDAEAASLFDLALIDLWSAIGKSRSERKAKFVKRVSDVAVQLEQTRHDLKMRVENQTRGT